MVLLETALSCHVEAYTAGVKFSSVQWLIILVGTVLYAFSLTALLRRNLWRRIPMLFAYLMVVFLRDQIYLYGLYFWDIRSASSFYWIGEGVIYVMSFLLVMSIWKEGLGRLRGLWAVTRWVLPGTLLVFLAFVRWNAQFNPGSSPRPNDWLSDWLRLLSQNLSLTQAVFLLGFFLVTSLFLVPLAPLVQRVAACWFAYSLAKVVLLATRYVVGYGFQPALDYAATIAFLGLLSSWAVLLWRAQPSDLQAPQPVYILQGGSRRLAGQLQAVNRTLSRLLKV